MCPPELRRALDDQQPRKLSIMFPTEDPDQWASHFYRAYSGSRGLVCKGDGEVATRLVDLDQTVDMQTGELPKGRHPRYWSPVKRESTNVDYREIDCPPETCPQFKTRQCRPVMNLQFLLPDVERVGIWQIDTSSWNSIRNVLSGIQLIKVLAGRISAIPLELSLVPLEVHPESGTKKTVHVLMLTAPYKVGELYQYRQLPPGQAILPPPDLEPPEDVHEGEQ